MAAFIRLCSTLRRQSADVHSNQHQRAVAQLRANRLPRCEQSPANPVAAAPHLPSQAPKPSAGPHKTRECLPLILLLRNRLKYALTGKEVTSILMQRLVEVDGKVRTDRTYPVGFMDVVDIPKTGEGRGGGDRPRDARVRAPCVCACV